MLALTFGEMFEFLTFHEVLIIKKINELITYWKPVINKYIGFM